MITNIARRNNNAFKILPEQSKSEDARAILKEEFKENIETDCTFKKKKKKYKDHLDSLLYIPNVV